jgi:hypothetical protein
MSFSPSHRPDREVVISGDAPPWQTREISARTDVKKLSTAPTNRRNVERTGSFGYASQPGMAGTGRPHAADMTTAPSSGSSQCSRRVSRIASAARSGQDPSIGSDLPVTIHPKEIAP